MQYLSQSCKSLNRQGVRGRRIGAPSAATFQQWNDGWLPDNISALDQGSQGTQTLKCLGGITPQGPRPKWGPLTFGPHVVRMGPGPVFDYDGWLDERVGPEIMPAFYSVRQGDQQGDVSGADYVVGHLVSPTLIL